MQIPLPLSHAGLWLAEREPVASDAPLPIQEAAKGLVSTANVTDTF